MAYAKARAEQYRANNAAYRKYMDIIREAVRSDVERPKGPTNGYGSIDLLRSGPSASPNSAVRSDKTDR